MCVVEGNIAAKNLPLTNDRELELIANPPLATDSKPLSVACADLLREDPVRCKNLAETLQRAVAAKTGGLIHLRTDGTEIEQSYSALFDDAKKILGGLRALGLRPGDKIIFQLDFTGDFIPAFWGAMLGGFVPVPISIAPNYEQANSTLSKLQNAWLLLEKPLVLTGEKLAPALRNLSVGVQPSGCGDRLKPELQQNAIPLENFRVETVEKFRDQTSGTGVPPVRSFLPTPSLSETHRRGACATNEIYDAQPDDIALMMLTSGSTGIPKAVPLTHRNILARSAGTVQMNGFSSRDVSFSWMPMDHVASIIYFHLRDVFTGCKQIHAPAPWILQNPLRWLDSLSRFKATVTFAPNFAFGLINERAAEIAQRTLDLSTVRYFLNGGEAVVARTARKFLQLLAPHGLRADAMRPAWGMSETCSGVTYGDRFSLATTSDNDQFVEVGQPIPGVSLRIADDQGKILREDEIGNLEITGVPIMSGYFQNADLNKQVFSKDGWFKTGDLGILHDGRLTITGRQKDVIIMNGVNYYSHEIESVVEQIDGVEVSFTAACAVRETQGEAEKLAIFFSPANSVDANALADLQKKIRAQVGRVFSINPDYVIPLAKKEIPKTEIGKIQRAKLRERFESREFQSLFSREESPGKKMAWCKGEPLTIDANEPKTLIDALLRAATQHPDKKIIFVGADGVETPLRFDELLVGAKRILTGLRRKGLKPGDYLILQIESARLHIMAFWGAALGGIIPITIAPPPALSPTHRVIKKVHQTWQLLGQPAILVCPVMVSPWRRLAETLSMQNAKIFCVEPERFEPAETISEAKPDDVLFLQLTSGSTGVPKCIQETHRSIIAHIEASKKFLGYSSDDVTLNWLPFDHVVPMLMFHLKDIYLGCEQVQARTDVVVNDPLRWLDLIEAHRVTHTWAPNFGFKLVTDALAKHSQNSWDLSSIKFFINAGEQVTMPVVCDFLKAVAPFGVKEKAMCPAFGMAEVCTCMTYQTQFDFEHGTRRFLKSSLASTLQPTHETGVGFAEFVSCGPVVPGVEIRIASQNNELLPEGVIGRLQIKGAVVTPGYFNNEAANRDAFVGDGWFNSGDLGFILDGELFLAGREKEMIIIRGAHFYCYELEEIAQRVEGVEPTFAAACAVQDSASGSEGLAIFFVPARGADAEKIIPLIRAKVAAATGIAPSHIVPIGKEDFPKTTSGKIQRTQLKKFFEAGELLPPGVAPEEKKSGAAELEQQVSLIWQEVLKKPRVTGTDSFFELGGDSLRAFQILARVREQFQIELPPGALFDEASTAAGMARWIETHSKVSASSMALVPVPRTGKLPLSFGQQRIWLLDQLAPGSSLYNVSRGVWFTGHLDPAILKRALNSIVARHEILRTIFVLDGDAPVQKILPELKVELPLFALEGFEQGERRARAESLAGIDAAKAFDLTHGPLLRFKLFRISDAENLLLLACHQIVIDGWSLGIFFEELAQAYEEISEGKDVSLGPLPIQYADFAIWRHQTVQREQIEKFLGFWKKQLAGPVPVLQLPADHPRSAIDTFRGDSEPLTIEPDFYKALKNFSREENATLFMTMLAAWKILLRHYSNEEDILVGSPVAGRNRVEIERLIGFFVGTIVLRTRVADGLNFRQLLARVRDAALGAFANADLPFEKIVEELQPERSAMRAPFFQTWFGFIDTMPKFTMGDISAVVGKLPESNAQFDLSLFVVEKTESALCLLEYKTDLFEPATIKKFLANFEMILREVVARPEIPLADLFEKIRGADLQRQNSATQQRAKTFHAALRQTQRRRSGTGVPTLRFKNTPPLSNQKHTGETPEPVT